MAPPPPALPASESLLHGNATFEPHDPALPFIPNNSTAGTAVTEFPSVHDVVEFRQPESELLQQGQSENGPMNPSDSQHQVRNEGMTHSQEQSRTSQSSSNIDLCGHGACSSKNVISKEQSANRANPMLKALDEILDIIDEQCGCSVCMELLNDPVTMECGHSFCSKCIKEWFETKKTCPLCRVPCELSRSSSHQDFLSSILKTRAKIGRDREGSNRLKRLVDIAPESLGPKEEERYLKMLAFIGHTISTTQEPRVWLSVKASVEILLNICSVTGQICENMFVRLEEAGVPFSRFLARYWKYQKPRKAGRRRRRFRLKMPNHQSVCQIAAFYTLFGLIHYGIHVAESLGFADAIYSVLESLCLIYVLNSFQM